MQALTWKRPLAALLAALLLAAPCARAVSYEDLDEETLAAQETPVITPDPDATPVPPEQVYAISDVNNPDEEGETRIEEGVRPDFVEKLLEVARGELGYAEGPHSFTKYGLWSGDANAEWCAEFICWCVDQVDQRYGTNLLDVMQMNVDAMLKLIPRISTPTRHEPELARLDPADFTALATKVIGFFVPKDTPTEYHYA